jgi:M6 family metalloprotease-like protein
VPPEVAAARAAGSFAVAPLASTRGTGGRSLLRPDSPSLAPIGDWHVPVILVSFGQQPPRFPPARFRTLLFDTTGANPNGSMAEYYHDVSHGLLRVTGDVIGWFSLPDTEGWYAHNGYGLDRTGWPRNTAGLVDDAVNAADPTVNFAQYDRDGDGEVDYLIVIHVGLGAEAASGDRDKLWSINANLTDYWDRVLPHKTNDLKPGSTTQHILVNRFSVLPERSWVDPDSMAEIGPYCHEFGHGLGWPDLYDASLIGGGPNLGPGNWCLMSFGAYGGGEAITPDRPTRPCAWAMYDAGWVTATNLSQSRAERFPPVENPDGRVYRLWWQGDASTEYFLLENRQRVGHDADLPAGGLLVYHVDEIAIASRRTSNLVNSGPFPGLRLEEADGHYDLMGRFDRGTGSDPFPGTGHVTQWDDETAPSTRTFDGRHTNVSLSQIALDGPDVTAWVQVSPAGWSAPTTHTLPGRLRTGGDRPLSRSGPHLDFLATNESDSSRVYATRRWFDVSWDVPQRVSTAVNASDATWSDPSGSPRLALWTDRRAGASEIFYRTWDASSGPETRATFSPAFAFRPAACWMPDGRLLLTWLDTRTGKGQVFYKLFFPGQEATAPESVATKATATPEIVEYAMAGVAGGHVVICYTVRASGADEVFWQHFDLGTGWSAPERLSDFDTNPSGLPDVVVETGGLVRMAWRDNTPTHSNFLSALYDPIQRTLLPATRLLFSSPLPIVTLRIGAGTSQFPIVLLTRASEPPNDRVLFGAAHADQTWDVGLGSLSAGVNAGGSDPMVDVTPQGTVTVFWIDPGALTSEAWSTTRQTELTAPVAVPETPAPPIAPRIAAAPNPATRFVQFSWSQSPAGAALTIYSPAGRIVSRFPTRARSIVWDGRDGSGAPLAPGIYFYRLEDEAGRAIGPAGKLVWLR